MFKDLYELIEKGDYIGIRDWYFNMSKEDRLLFLLDVPNADLDKVIISIDIAGYIKGREDEAFVKGYNQGVKECIDIIENMGKS